MLMLLLRVAKLSSACAIVVVLAVLSCLLQCVRHTLYTS
jgi:hypothetical protein